MFLLQCSELLAEVCGVVGTRGGKGGLDRWGGRVGERDGSGAVCACLLVLEWSWEGRVVGCTGGGCGFRLVVVVVP